MTVSFPNLRSKEIENNKDFDRGAVLWLTGFSGAGKTTVARIVNTLLRDKGVNTVFLDGDDLRAMFGGHWGYSRAERIELAHSYLRLCSSLSAQGYTVVISAVAMYNEVYAWFRENIDFTMLIYLDVPEIERKARDENTKQVYKTPTYTESIYETPSSPDLVIENFGIKSPFAAAKEVVDNYVPRVRKVGSDKGRTVHWNSYYKSGKLIFEPSSFSVYCADQMIGALNILEIGCGNGRDAIYFSELGHNVTAIDPSIEAINLCIEKHGTEKVNFKACKLPDCSDEFNEKLDVIYSRFCFHAMTEKEEIETLEISSTLLKQNGSIYIECRSINDPLSRKGDFISSNERSHGHYRRFIVLDDLKKNLINSGFVVNKIYESGGLAVLGDDNPVVIRVHATKQINKTKY